LDAEELWNKIDWEGGFYEAFLGYGIDLKDFKLPAELKKEIVSILKVLKPMHKRVRAWEEALYKAAHPAEE
jgi:hypothetical protein